MFLSVSIVLVKVMYSNGHVATLVRMITGLSVRFIGFIFVDDMDLVVIASSPEESSMLIVQQVQAGGLTWQGALQASGGVLEPSKCHWSLIDFIWINGEWQYHLSRGMLVAISIPDENGNEIIIDRLELDEAIKVVGVHQAANARWEHKGSSGRQDYGFRNKDLRKLGSKETCVATVQHDDDMPGMFAYKN